MKRLLNPLIERLVNQAFAVDQYADMFEKLALRPQNAPLMRRLFGHKVAEDVRRHPLLFIHIPKNGGTSIKRALYASDPGHATVRFYDMVAPELLRGATSFALLREPADRFLSGFDFLMNGGGSDVSILPSVMRRLSCIASIDDFLDYLEAIAGDWLKVDTFGRPQWWYVADRHGRIRIDRLWLLGEQNSAVAEFLAGWGVPNMPHANRTARASHVLSPPQRARLERIYAADFALYALVRQEPGIGSDALLQKLPSALRSVLQL